MAGRSTTLTETQNNVHKMSKVSSDQHRGRNVDFAQYVLGNDVTQSLPSTSVAGRLETEPATDDEIWCVCRRPYGGRDMIECEFDGCPYKWFHLDCIGLSQAAVPKGKWFCKQDRCKEARQKKATPGGKRKRQVERLVGHMTR